MDPKEFVKQFDAMIEQLEDQIPLETVLLLKQIENLKRTRDQILSGMMQGHYNIPDLPGV